MGRVICVVYYSSWLLVVLVGVAVVGELPSWYRCHTLRRMLWMEASGLAVVLMIVFSSWWQVGGHMVNADVQKCVPE